MSRRITSRLAWALCGICVGATLLGLALEALNRYTAQRASFIFPNTFVLALCFPIVGAVIAMRQPKNAIGWLFCAIGLLAAIPILAIPYAVYTFRVNPGALPGGALMSWIGYWTFLPAYSLIPLLLLLFPDGRLLSRPWRWVAWANAIGVTLATSEVAWLSWPMRGVALLSYAEGGSDIQFEGGVISQILTIIEIPLLLGSSIASIMAIVLRFGRSQGVERQQLKWFTYAIALAACIQLLIGILTSLYGEISNNLLSVGLLALSTISIVGVAVAVGIAILRYQLYDIDVIIRRTLVYSTLTATLALVYVGCIVVSRTLVAPLTGGSELAIVASTLAIAALFNPLRKRIQNLIDKRFYRRKYDAGKVLAAFGATVRDETDLERLTDEMLRVVDETMQPEFVELWLRERESNQGSKQLR